MRIAFVDLEEQPADKAAGDYAFGKAPQQVASPSLLARAARALADGNEVSYHYLSPASLVDPVVHQGLREKDCIVIRCPGGSGGRNAGLAATLRAALWGAADRAAEAVRDRFELFDPWSADAAGAEQLPAYHLARGLPLAHAEADVEPATDPVHPWVCPSVSTVSLARAEERLEAAVQALAGVGEGHLILSDDRVPLDMVRLRSLAERVRAALASHRTILQLHVRAWPADLLGERLLDHLSLLPVGSLDLLAGSLLGPSLGRMGSALTVADVARAAAEVHKSGLAHLTRLSLVLGLPGESADDCVTLVREAFRLALACRIPRLRFAFWRGEAAGQGDSADQKNRFLRAHPDWHELEYQGLQDLVALSSTSYPQLKVVGP